MHILTHSKIHCRTSPDDRLMEVPESFPVVFLFMTTDTKDRDKENSDHLGKEKDQ